MSQDIRKLMIDVCLRMNSSGINQGTSGNLSVRTDRGFLITPTSLRYEIMKPEDIVEMDFEGRYEGLHRPSSEWRFHRDILAARPDRNVVLHCHSVFATSLAVHRIGIPAFHYMIGLAGGSEIRCASYAAYGTQELSDYALEALGELDACLLANHGQIAIGADLERALRLAIEVENLARGYLQARILGEPVRLNDAEMSQVLEQMRRMRYGQPPDLDGVQSRAQPLS